MLILQPNSQMLKIHHKQQGQTEKPLPKHALFQIPTNPRSQQSLMTVQRRKK